MTENEINEILAGNGKVNEIRNYVICMGQTSSSKGVMFVLYSELKKCNSPYVNPFIYLGQLADDFENAVLRAREKVHGFKIEVWDDETFKERKRKASSNPETLIVEFGKYNGMTVKQIFDVDYNYLYWLANNGNFRNKFMQDAMEQYKDICKELIVTNNREKSQQALPVETELSIKKLTIKSIDVVNGVYGSTYRVKLVDEKMNKFIYNGNSSSVIYNTQGDSIEFKCRIAGNYESFGVTFNVLKVRK